MDKKCVRVGLGRILVGNDVVIKCVKNLSFVEKNETFMVFEIINDDWKLETDRKTYCISDEEWGFVKWSINGEINCPWLITRRQFEKEKEEGSWQHTCYEPIFFKNYDEAEKAYLDFGKRNDLNLI